ncbi:MAG: FAD-dependent oxidoreductase, partial [Cytophagales bacterium]|nr:FAD-dependent oxidoreductase [Cytophagales bacterium]
DFLKKLNFQENLDLGVKTGIIGGGNTAIDSARTAKRLGKDVTIFYRRTRNEMPANPEEVEAAIHEGIKIEFLDAPDKIVTEDGKLKSLELIRMKQGTMNSNGRRRPVPVPDSQFKVSLDVLIPAVSQKPDSEFAKEAGIEVTKWDTLSVDDRSLSTKIEGIFACADVVTGPSSVTEAMAHGRKAAVSINRYLKGIRAYSNTALPKREEESLKPVMDYQVSDEELERLKEIFPSEKRVEMPCIEDSQRLVNFEEVELG